MIEWVIIIALWALGFYTNVETFIESFGNLSWPRPVAVALCLFWPLFAVVGAVVEGYGFVERVVLK